MAKESGSTNPYDLERIRELVTMMEKHGLTTVDLQGGDGTRVRLRRGGEHAAFLPQMPAMMMPQAMPPQAMASAASPAAPSAPAKEDGTFIKSPTVGTFYGSPSPGEEPFVKVGSKVSAATTVCIIEAMKVFNQIAAELDGTITEVLAKNGDAVEFGQPLFRVNLG
jgi:acetyl-CoA carboxylase biotin carboxyl carrier protein